VVALCGAEERAGAVLLDRKFHVGMLGYVQRMERPMACLLPPRTAAEIAAPAGSVWVPRADLPYRVSVVSGHRLGPADRALVARLLDRTTLAYLGDGGALNAEVALQCRRRGIPYAVTTEYTLRTALEIMRADTPSTLRRLVRSARLRWRDRARRATLARAAELHANGFPTYQELARVNPARVLFFDTRALAADVIGAAAVQARLESLARRPARLLFSGRYLPMKGALDVVLTGLALHRAGLDFRLDTYGEGPLAGEMRALVQRGGAGAVIRVHDPIPYRPDLIERTREADLFLACHVQGDPSCTYLETFACGVPVAGYANEMWTALQRHSLGGVAVPVGDHAALARATMALLADPARLRDAALGARAFAAANTMEAGWDLRVARLLELARA
jgi:glycosyltransferase involved in cell wall biosynthesis